MRILVFFLSLLIFAYPAFGATYKLKSGDILITDFESHPNYMEGNVGVYGAIGSEKAGDKLYSGYTSEVAYTGNKSYRLVFKKGSLWKPEYEQEYERSIRGAKRTEDIGFTSKPTRVNWAVFMLDMGPVADSSTVPVKIQPVDISKFRYLVFWVRGRRGREQFKVYLRDAHATTYDPQVKVKPKVVVTKRWKPVAVNLRKLKRKVDLGNIVQIGIGFGTEDGGKAGNVFYVDDFILIR